MKLALIPRHLALIGGLTAILAGCAKEPDPVPVAPVKVQVVDHDYCAIMRRINGASGVFPWAVDDTTLSITRMRRANAAFNNRCASRSNPTPTS